MALLVMLAVYSSAGCMDMFIKESSMPYRDINKFHVEFYSEDGKDILKIIAQYGYSSSYGFRRITSQINGSIMDINAMSSKFGDVEISDEFEIPTTINTVRFGPEKIVVWKREVGVIEGVNKEPQFE